MYSLAFMCVCIYVYVCLCLCVCLFTRMYVYVYVGVCVWTTSGMIWFVRKGFYCRPFTSYVCAHACVCVCVCVREWPLGLILLVRVLSAAPSIHVCMCACVCACVQVCICAHFTCPMHNHGGLVVWHNFVCHTRAYLYSYASCTADEHTDEPDTHVKGTTDTSDHRTLDQVDICVCDSCHLYRVCNGYLNDNIVNARNFVSTLL